MISIQIGIIENSIKIDELSRIAKSGDLHSVLLDIDQIFLEYDKVVVSKNYDKNW